MKKEKLLLSKFEFNDLIVKFINKCLRKYQINGLINSGMKFVDYDKKIGYKVEFFKI